MAYLVMAYIGMAYIGKAYIVMAYLVMAYIVMVPVSFHSPGAAAASYPSVFSMPLYSGRPETAVTEDESSCDKHLGATTMQATTTHAMPKNAILIWAFMIYIGHNCISHHCIDCHDIGRTISAIIVYRRSGPFLGRSPFPTPPIRCGPWHSPFATLHRKKASARATPTGVAPRDWCQGAAAARRRSERRSVHRRAMESVPAS